MVTIAGKTRAAIASLLLALLSGCATTTTDTKLTHSATIVRASEDQALIELSKQKWLWMADAKTDLLNDLFHEQAVFVHMGATFSKAQEIDVISTGKIHYKKADIENTSVKIIGDTAILLTKLRLIAVVGENEVTNPFVVTEVYIRQIGSWKLGSMSFTRLLGE